MTENSTKNTTRSTLTLKISGNKDKNIDNKSEKVSEVKNKTSTVSKSSRSSVEVTIKGRKSPAKATSSNSGSDLNKDELKERIKAINESSQHSEKKEIKTHEILSKISKETKSENLAAETQSENIEEVIAEKSLKPLVSKQNSSDLAQTDNKKLVDIELDNFDVRNKIKESLKIANQQKEEREKTLEEKRKKEQELLLEKQKSDNEKKKGKKPFSNSVAKVFNEDDFVKKNNIKESKTEKFNSRRLTYFINSGEDDEDDFTFGSYRRKKPKAAQIQKEESKEYKKIVREVMLPELITVAELSERMSEKTGDVVKKLFSMGMVVTSNQAIDAETAEIIINEFGHICKKVSFSDVENILEDKDTEGELLPRAPIVTIMGHVDHGKTSLLDALRLTDVAALEHGGITQHIGASRIETKDHKFITFLDTPGHEAFTEMRSRGANVTDIVVLVVAADDGVKEQTIEAINHAKAANVPIIVAVNKIDKPGANPQIVKNELLNHQLVSEDLGGDVMFVPVSAKAKTNLDKLEEAILLQAEILELKAPYSGKSSGVVLESRVDPSKGVVTTVLVQKGTLDIGDIVVAGTSYGKIRKMTDGNNKLISIATPSIPVEILGLDKAPSAGDKFVEVNEERQAREIISYRLRKEKEEKSLKNSAKSISDIFKESGKGKLKYLNIILKGDVHGSVEAINGSISKISNDEVAIKIIHSATGGITENDVSLASASKAMIIGFNVRANLSAKELANNKLVDIRYYSIIYNLVDDLKMLLSGLLNPIKSEEYLGQAEIRQIFKISNAGKVAGCFVTDGFIKKNARIRLLRDNIVIYDGVLKALKRFKDDVKEVKNGFECGLTIDNFDDIKEKDVVECYEITEQKRTIN